MAVHPLKTEDRRSGANFTGTGFLFVRSWQTWDDTYPFEVGLHQHEWHEFVWNHSPADGPSHIYTLDGEPHAYGGGCLLYAPPFHAHKFLVAKPLKFWLVGIDQTQMCKLFAHSPLARPLEQLFGSWQNLPYCMDTLSGAGELAQSVVPAARALDELCSRNLAAGSLDSLEAVHFLASLDRILEGWKKPAREDGAAVAGSEGVVRAAMEFLERNFSRPVGVDECAAHIGVARSTLSHSFRALTGQSIPRWLMEIRLRHARALLVETSLDIIEIALECGFNDPAWFSRQFRAAMGVPPSEWRSRSRAMLKTPDSLHDHQGHD